MYRSLSPNSERLSSFMSATWPGIDVTRLSCVASGGFLDYLQMTSRRTDDGVSFARRSRSRRPPPAESDLILWIMFPRN